MRLVLPSSALLLLTSCLMDQYNPSAIDPDDSGPLVVGDADTDADTDSDTDTDKEVTIDIASVTPSYGTTRGGTEITIVGGPFDSSATVVIGDTQAPVLAAQNSVITAVTNSMDTGTFDVKVTTDNGFGRLDSSYSVFEDGTGKVSTIGEFWWIDYKGQYWNPSPPDDTGGVWFGFIEPVDGFAFWQVYNNSENGCSSEYVYSGSDLTVMDLGTSSATLSAGAKNLDLTWIGGSTNNYETALTSASQFTAGASYTLKPMDPSNGWPQFSVDDFVYMPGGLTLTQPLIDQQYLPDFSRNQTFRWSGGGDGDRILIVLNLLSSDQNSVAESITCVVPNTGSYTMSSGVWNSYVSGRVIVVMVGAMVDDGGGIIDVTNAGLGMAGSHFVYGGGYTL
ncbi:MAG: hypothetical protein GY913_01010 [Proteobacteria bacterium]|nr:hypothetical protein [Pseudomonadota bacterium]MCP4915477.1 hypothetical protein [Pseudomonadota bacterium]